MEFLAALSDMMVEHEHEYYSSMTIRRCANIVT
jgi:hypothetical protein